LYFSSLNRTQTNKDAISGFESEVVYPWCRNRVLWNFSEIHLCTTK